jgi:hypothetical protein
MRQAPIRGRGLRGRASSSVRPHSQKPLLLRPAAAKRKRCSASRLGADKATTATSARWCGPRFIQMTAPRGPPLKVRSWGNLGMGNRESVPASVRRRHYRLWYLSPCCMRCRCLATICGNGTLGSDSVLPMRSRSALQRNRRRFAEHRTIFDCKAVGITETVKARNRSYGYRRVIQPTQIAARQVHPAQAIIRPRAHPQMLGA